MPNKARSEGEVLLDEVLEPLIEWADSWKWPAISIVSLMAVVGVVARFWVIPMPPGAEALPQPLLLVGALAILGALRDRRAFILALAFVFALAAGRTFALGGGVWSATITLIGVGCLLYQLHRAWPHDGAAK